MIISYSWKPPGMYPFTNLSSSGCNILLSSPQCRLEMNLRCGFQDSSFSKWRLSFLYYVFFKIDKTLWVFLPHILIMLQCFIFMNATCTLNLYHPYGFVPDHFDILIHDAYWFHLEIPFVLHLDHNPINYVVRVRNISL